ncbi:hypothetical protein BGZ81_011506 [Podila clonocystis]|nr:hypothetical protein BGZ81_011506 [Podila clonocystis]
MLLIKSLLVLCSAAAVMARSQADAVMSAGLFFGEDTTDSLNPLEIYRNPINHATAAASVLVYSATRAGFHPSEKSAESLVPAFDNFVQKVSAFPGFVLEFDRQTGFPLKNHTTVEEFEQLIRDVLSGASHSEKLAFKFAGLVPLHQKDESLKNWILSLVVLDQPQGSHAVSFQLANLRLSIAYEHTCTGTKAYIPEQTVYINNSIFRINAAFLSAYADQFADMIPIVDVEHMIAFFTSPEPEIDSLRVWLSAQRRIPAF